MAEETSTFSVRYNQRVGCVPLSLIICCSFCMLVAGSCNMCAKFFRKRGFSIRNQKHCEGISEMNNDRREQSIMDEGFGIPAGWDNFRNSIVVGREYSSDSSISESSRKRIVYQLRREYQQLEGQNSLKVVLVNGGVYTCACDTAMMQLEPQ